MKIFSVFSCVFFFSICEAAHPQEKTVWERVIESFVINEADISREQLSDLAWKIAIKRETTFPKDVLGNLKHYEIDGQCSFLKGEWSNLVDQLALANEEVDDLSDVVEGLSFAVLGTRLEHDDYLSLSRVILIKNDKYALLSVGISELAGVVVLVENTNDNDWANPIECAEWARF